MNGGLIIPDKETAKTLNDLARHTAIVRILNDMRMDMEICEIEGWDKNEYLNLIRQLLNSIGGQNNGKTDTISRQAAIDALKDWYDGMIISSFRGIEKVIKALPSAQPETATVTIGRTKGGVVMWYECGTCGESIDKKDCYCRNCGRKLKYE